MVDEALPFLLGGLPLQRELQKIYSFEIIIMTFCFLWGSSDRLLAFGCYMDAFRSGVRAEI